MISASEEYREVWRLYSQFKEEQKSAMTNVNTATCPDWSTKRASRVRAERLDEAEELDNDVMSVVGEGSEEDDEDNELRKV